MPPRMTRPLLVGTLAVGLILFFCWGPSFNGPYMNMNGGWHAKSIHVPTLAERLRAEEVRYAETLKARQALIEKNGDIQAYPTTGSYTLWDFFIPAFQCPHHVERIGVLGDGGKWVCGVERLATQEKCVVYSFGINGESSFEAALLERAPGCEVWGYDFTVNGFGPEIEGSSALKARSHFRPFALGGKNAHGPEDNPKYYTLDALMKLNGHDFIDVLKIDIEGAEFSTLTTFLAANKPENSHSRTVLPIGQLQLELHAWDDFAKFDFFHGWWSALEAVGLRPFWTEPNLVYVNYAVGGKPKLAEYSYINIRGNHSIIYDPTEGDFADL